MKLPPARATMGLLALNGLVWAIITIGGFGDLAAWTLGLVPGRFGHPDVDAAMIGYAREAGYPHFFLMPVWLTPLTSAITHVQPMHLAFNLLMIGFCGRFVELGLGAKGLVALYIAGALAAALAHYLWDPGALGPAIGASGAGSAIIAAYALLYGTPRPVTANRRLNRTINVAWLAAAWIGIQLLMGYANAGSGAAISFMGHIGGFLAGLALARPLLLFRYRHA